MLHDGQWAPCGSWSSVATVALLAARTDQVPAQHQKALAGGGKAGLDDFARRHAPVPRQCPRPHPHDIAVRRLQQMRGQPLGGAITLVRDGFGPGGDALAHDRRERRRRRLKATFLAGHRRSRGLAERPVENAPEAVEQPEAQRRADRP
jgi:hypothetical protein